MKNKRKILVVDDDQDVLTLVQGLLEDKGFEIKAVQSADKAFEYVQNEFFDVVYTDLVLSQMSGSELCRKIKEASPRTEVVLFASSPFEVDQHQTDFIEAGGRDELLRKPVDHEILLSITQNIMNELSYKYNLPQIKF